ncbi:hypothetical protein [Chitinophaga rupis]|uniref:hypothetical protein n=1 Tax=Chitinophaga rupis TaxID=573321 RepID=UPI00116091B2|nr:hypothetical protein [Chitinophaga rupis]
MQDRNSWESCKSMYNADTDLVLTIDFGLKREIERMNGKVQYLDHLIDTAYLEEKNYEMHRFLNSWYRNKANEDIFTLDGIGVGNTFLLNILNDITYNVHFFINILALKRISHEKIICAVSDQHIIYWLKALKYVTDFIPVTDAEKGKPAYFFPIHEWMESRLEKRSGFEKLKAMLLRFVDYGLAGIDLLQVSKKPLVFIQSYYPTKKIIDILERDKRVRLLLVNYTGLKKLVTERRIKYTRKKVAQQTISNALDHFKSQKVAQWQVEGYDISEFLYGLLIPKLPLLLSRSFSRLMDIKNYLKNKSLKLMIPVTDLWMENRLIMNYCKKNNIPIYMIINGLLTHNFVYDGKDVDLVNAYGSAIKEDYFENKENVVCLGDPRMDYYAIQPPKEIDRRNPVIIIGAAGYSPIDLNSYLAYEFEFLSDILECFREQAVNGQIADIIIKVRANGYRNQYENFIREYFPDMKINIIQDMPFATLIARADFYISFYSQTVIEAACLGIPALYYKNDRQVINKPFDNNSELITANNREELKEKWLLYLKGDKCYDHFLNKKVLEKYVGPLDGKNVERNVAFIYKLLN